MFQVRAYALLFVWVASSTLLCALTAGNFLSLLANSLNDTFGSIFPAIPFAALLTVIFALRWPDLRGILEREARLSSDLTLRLTGVAVVEGLVLLRGYTGQMVELSAVAIVATFYATSLALIPGAKRLVLPYALTYGAGVAAPTILQWAFGEPLATVSTWMSSYVVSLTGIPITWQGMQFAVISKTGDLVSATVTPGCSSIISITTFLGLLVLMHIDLRKDAKSTVELAVAGVVALTLLNSVRIAILIWVGYVNGAAAFWGIHNWVGYAIFIGFYLVAIFTYSRMRGGPKAGLPSGTVLGS